MGDNAVLRRVRDYIAKLAEPEGGYGYFPAGSDPRKFHPDEEVNTPAEMEAWRAACLLWDRGTPVVVPGPHDPLVVEGKVVGHTTRAHFGMGSYEYVDEDAVELLAAIDAELAPASPKDEG